MDKKRIRILINLIMAFTVIAVWVSMFFIHEEGMLISKGIENLKYFTELSNILESFACVFWIAVTVRKKAPGWAERIKYMACAAVALTFIVVSCFFGPLYGYLNMYKGANLFFHLIIPVLAMAEFVFLNETVADTRDNLIIILFPLLYGIVYVLNCIFNGIQGNDWYAFLAWGYPVGVVIFIMICAAMAAVGLLLRILNKVYMKHRKQR